MKTMFDIIKNNKYTNSQLITHEELIKIIHQLVEMARHDKCTIKYISDTYVNSFTCKDIRIKPSIRFFQDLGEYQNHQRINIYDTSLYYNSVTIDNNHKSRNELRLKYDKISIESLDLSEEDKCFLLLNGVREL